jgi:hypothetical protein
MAASPSSSWMNGANLGVYLSAAVRLQMTPDVRRA